jgi:hypothetical protein
MTITYTPSVRLETVTANDPSVANNWATFVNNNMTLIDQAFTAQSTISIGGLTSYVLTVANGASDQARQAVLPLTGALSGVCTVILPNVPKVGWVSNNTTGGFSVTLTTAAGGATVNATVPPDGFMHLYLVDSSGNVTLPVLAAGSTATVNGNSLTVNGNGTITGTLSTGPLTVSGLATISGGISVGGSTTFAAVTATTLNATSSITSVNLTLSGIATVNGNLTANTMTAAGSGGFSTVGALSVGGNSSLKAVTATSVSSTGAISSQSSVGVGSSGNGSVSLAPGSSATPGSVGFYNSSGTRIGYLGSSVNLGNGVQTLLLESENGFSGWECLGIFNVSTNTTLSANATILMDPISGPVVLNIDSVPSPAQPFTALGINLASAACSFATWQFNGSSIGSIQPNLAGTAVSYNTTSDQRLKIDHGSVAPDEARQLLMAIKPRWFNWRVDPDGEPEIGFFAQQLHRWFPWAVVRGHGRPNRSNFVPWQVDNSKLIPVLVAALQDAIKRIDELERRP